MVGVAVEQYILNNYIIDNFVDIEVFRSNFPALDIIRIAPNIYTIEVPDTTEARGQFERLRSTISFVTTPILYGLSAMPALSASNILQFHDYPYGELRGAGIIVGFVDTGIDYNNVLFKNADNTTRIVSIWDQTISGNPPTGYNYGTVYTKEEIDNALQNANPYSVVPTRDENGHGTFLAGVATGNDQTGQMDYTGGAPDATIAMVKLRPASTYLREIFSVNENVPAFQDNDIIAGINYLMGLALAQQKPLIICLGIGSNYGAHNGTEIMENYISDISIASDVIIVIAAGNEGSSGHHYRGEVTEGGSESLEINVGANETGFSMFVWVDIPNKMSVSLKSPLGQVIEKIPITYAQPSRFKLNLEETTVIVTYMYPDPLTGGQKIDVKLDKPTAGLWTLTVYGDVIVSGVFHIWLPRKGFIQEDTRFLKPDPQTTIEIPGTEQYGITVGSYDYLDDSVYVSSGRGPTTEGIIKPDLIAPGVNIQGPVPGGGFTTYVGTSAAAAITASAAALLMEWAILNGNFPVMNTRIARSILIRGARRQDNVVYPNNIEGYGRLDLQASIAKA